MLVRVEDINAKKRCLNDLLYVYESDLYMNQKGYLQKLIDLLYKLGYYEDNKSLFQKG